GPKPWHPAWKLVHLLSLAWHSQGCNTDSSCVATFRRLLALRRQGFAHDSEDEVVRPTLGRTHRGFEPAIRLLRERRLACGMREGVAGHGPSKASAQRRCADRSLLRYVGNR